MQTTSLGCTGMKEYKKKPVKLSKKLLEWIDDEVRTLVIALNREGYPTSYSCSGGPGHTHSAC